jgi:hypothetical protein
VVGLKTSASIITIYGNPENKAKQHTRRKQVGKIPPHLVLENRKKIEDKHGLPPMKRFVF